MTTLNPPKDGETSAATLYMMERTCVEGRLRSVQEDDLTNGSHQVLHRRGRAVSCGLPFAVTFNFFISLLIAQN
ncbi:hypothetical protein [Aureibacillus halotolerans]|uniref:hypothetical protein n=1 Tax=Aureibacillus halotolerans TaxID=1508390 RepID=UPI00105E13CD|nr:hypothetical protein [Aureibacillus halotolerans]